MTKEDAWNYIEEISKCGSVLGLESVKRLLDKLDNPQDKLKVIHIAGTNGKGSVGAFLSQIMMEAGYKVGRYVSPTIFTYLERFQINKEYMKESEFVQILDAVKKASDDMVEEGYARPTAFETETAVSFMYFLSMNVDAAIIETGMGGIDDATNVCRKPLCTILTSISMDHMQFLGNSIYDILEAKLGIIKKNVPCISDYMEESLKNIWLKKCEDMSSDHIMLDIANVSVIKNDINGIKYLYKDREYDISILGSHQINNSILAVLAAELLNEYGYDLDYVSISKGLHNAKWQGRMEKIHDEPPVYVDGAHNEGGWLALKNNIEAYFKGKNIIYICGVLRDKEYNRMLDILSEYSDWFIAVTPDSMRALSGTKLAELAGEKIKHSMYVPLDEAMDKAFEIANNISNPLILVFGSLSFIGPIIERYGEYNGQN